jgi:acyl-CoA thioesterase I
LTRPDVSKASLDGILKEAQARGLPVLLVGMKAPGNFGPEYKAAFDGMYAELAATVWRASGRGFLRRPDGRRG